MLADECLPATAQLFEVAVGLTFKRLGTIEASQRKDEVQNDFYLFVRRL